MLLGNQRKRKWRRKKISRKPNLSWKTSENENENENENEHENENENENENEHENEHENEQKEQTFEERGAREGEGVMIGWVWLSVERRKKDERWSLKKESKKKMICGFYSFFNSTSHNGEESRKDF